jgi:uncharacterized protein YjdB
MRFTRVRARYALLIVAALACSDATSPVPEKRVASVTVVASTHSIRVGDTLRVSARALASDGTLLEGRPVTWTSTNSDVLELSGTGLATAVAPGTASIRATIEGKSGSVDVVVNVLPVDRVAIIETSISLAKGEVHTLVAATLDAEGRPLDGRTIAWRSENALTAEVDATGRVTGRNEGETKIFAESVG